MEPVEGLTRTTYASRIPALLHTCYLARKTALETFLALLRSYERTGYRVPFTSMVRSCEHALQMMHLSTFHPYPRLPKKLQRQIWKLVFLRNTTFNAESCHTAFQQFVTTEETDYSQGNGYCTVYSSPIDSPPRGKPSVSKAQDAELCTAFWTYHEHRDFPFGMPEAIARRKWHIHLP